jgi:hypothetical protein
LSLYQIADLIVDMNGMGDNLQRLMKAYETDQEKADIIMNIHQERLRETGKKYPHLTPDEWEYIQTGSSFACRLPDFQGFCLHSSAIAFRERAILFSGPSGTGKSTHTNLWQQYFGSDKVVIINDDKPALRCIRNTFFVYGTPWSGKSTLNTNIRVPLGAVVFLKQAKENRLRRLSNQEAVQLLIYQSMRPNNSKDRMEQLLILIDQLLRMTPIYQLECNISFDAVKAVYNELINIAWSGEKNEN